MNSNYSIEKFTRPYPYILMADFLSEDDALAMREYILSNAKWHLHSESFFEQYECKFISNDYDLLLNFGKEVKVLLENEFLTKLSDDFQVVSHKLIKDQRIEIHNDCPMLGFETHRFVVNLNPDFNDASGGHLFVVSQEDMKVSKILRPLINSAFGFAASKKSFHAISRVKAGERISLVFSYYHVGNTPYVKKYIQNTIESARKENQHLIPKSDIDILLELQVDKIKTLHANLYEHLIDTYCLLKYWGHDDLTASVGLFHSILGAPSFSLPQSVEAKRLLKSKDEILFSLVSRYKIFVPDKYNLEGNSKQDFILLIVFFANMICGKINCFFDEQEWYYEQELFYKYCNYLPDTMVNSLKILYEGCQE